MVDDRLEMIPWSLTELQMDVGIIVFKGHHYITKSFSTLSAYQLPLFVLVQIVFYSILEAFLYANVVRSNLLLSIEWDTV